MIARAQVTTAKPVAYMRQLCKHFGHRLESSYDESTGSIKFDQGACELVAGGDQLTLVVAAADAGELARLQGVIGSHLERFGRRDELAVSWQSPAEA
jgi:hypothetical protein